MAAMGDFYEYIEENWPSYKGTAWGGTFIIALSIFFPIHILRNLCWGY